MRSTIIKEITKKGLDSYFAKRQYAEMFYPTFFPQKNVLRLDYTTLIGEHSGMVAADVIAYDASAPLKSRQVVSKLTGEIPKIAIKRKMSEIDMLDYSTLTRMADPDQKQIIDLIWGDVDFVVTGVNSRIEWMALQAISKTKIILTTANNNGIVTEEAVDFMMPTANKSGAAVAWTTGNVATMTPITDFKNVTKSARAKGVRLAYALMHPDTFDLFTAATETQNFLKAAYKLLSTDTFPMENVNSVNQVLRNANLPEIRIIDQSVLIETKAGVIGAVNPFDANYVTFIPEATLGNLLNAPIAEELFPPKQVTQSKAGLVLVSKFSELDPVAEFTKGEANAFPSWININQCFSMKATATSWS